MRMRRRNLFRLHYLRRQNFSFNFYINENPFFAWYTLISHEWESYSKRPESINVLPLNTKIYGGLLLRFFFVQYICNLSIIQIKRV